MFGITFKVSGYQVFKLSQSLFIWCYKNKRNKKTAYMQHYDEVIPNALEIHHKGLRVTKTSSRRSNNINRRRGK